MDILTRFLLKVTLPDDPDGCWQWVAAKSNQGYGRFKEGRKLVLAHRFSYRHFIGPIPEGLFVLHRCDNPGCVNPNHLFLGTNSDNVADMIAKGRAVVLRGMRNGRAKLTDEQVRAIRTSTVSQSEIAKQFGVSQGHVSHIRRGKKWATET